jgi:photosystem II stability/assembly factor-like uncharacterized protein
MPVAAAAAANTTSSDDAFWLDEKILSGLELRGIGPAVSSGRISDIAVDPTDHSRIFVTVASGGVWRSTNAGTTWEPVFDGEGSYSIGCVTIDPNDPNVVWVGTGENNAQRSVSFGDGVYKSLDGGSTWTNVGLDESEHIGNIVVDPRDSDVVWVSAHGPLWRPGGDRGLYRTKDGGATWERVLHISDDTGVAEVRLHPDDPDTILATSYQRRRHTWTLINGGPESGFHKSTDGGATWREITAGLPTEDRGRMGLCISPVDTDVVYGVVDAARGEGGFFRSTNRGETWEKRSSHAPGGDYYNELFCDPANVDRVYSMDTWMQVTHDGGATFEHVGETHKHVDNHALWINPDDPRHLRAGCDGGVYETFDRGATWSYFENLPIMQFYRATVDNSEPFYYIYGGTQDNATLGGPTRTRHRAGIANEDWFVTVFGDGFETVVDPVEPNIVYSQWQYGGLVRYDRGTGEAVDIQPQPAPGEDPLRWNWDAPVIVSPHSHTRLYFAAQKLFRSDDRGDTWTAVSEDLSRGIDRNALEVMGRVWGPDAVYKSGSTSIYGNAVALTESPVEEGVIYVGTDDGQVHATSDGGESWHVVGDFPGVPTYSYVAELEASQHDADTVFATFTNHKQGDFTPYVLKSTDRGRSWTSIAANLPDREIAWTIAQDHVDENLLFLGTEFSLWVSVNGGGHWVKHSGGLPTIAVRDLDIQRRENDLALGTFGRGFYILDDYTPLRGLTEETLAEEAALFPVKDALRYIETSRLGLVPLDKMFMGDTYYVAPNPPFGAVFTYHLAEGLKTLQERRIEIEKEADEKNETLPYPSHAALRAEDEELDPQILLTVRDADGAVVQRMTGPREKGLHRVAWNLRYPSPLPTDPDPGPMAPWDSPRFGPLALPGTYTVELAKVVDGAVTPLAGPESFAVVDLGGGTLPVENSAGALEFHRQASELQRAVLGAVGVADEMRSRIEHLRQAILDTPKATPEHLAALAAIEADLNDTLVVLRGDRSKAKRNEPVDPSVVGRIGRAVAGQMGTTQPPTTTSRDGYRWAEAAFTEQLAALKAIEARLANLEDDLESAGAPWTPGRFPDWP